MMIGKLVFGGLLVFVALPGCSSSDDNAKAKQQCEDLITTFCSGVKSCEVEGGLIESSEKASEVATCESGVKEDLDCSKAMGTSSTYPTCMSKLKNPPCDDINQAAIDGTLDVPSECKGSILVSQ